MATVVLLTAAILPRDDLETPLVGAALADLGIGSAIVAWTCEKLAEQACDLVVIRTTWDYTTQLAEFLAVLGSLHAPVRNGVEVVRWNSHKGYLIELAEADVPVVPTTVVSATDFVDASSLQLPDVGSAQVVLKPAVSAGARGTRRYRADAPEAMDHLKALLAGGDALVQPYQPEVTAGERSLIFLGGRYSHGVL